MKVVNGEDSLDSGICQNPTLASIFKNILAPSCRKVYSTEVSWCFCRISDLDSSVRSVHILTSTVPVCFCTSEADCSTLEMTPCCHSWSRFWQEWDGDALGCWDCKKRCYWLQESVLTIHFSNFTEGLCPHNIAPQQLLFFCFYYFCREWLWTCHLHSKIFLLVPAELLEHSPDCQTL